MADIKISALSSAGALAGTEAVPIVQSGATVKTTTQAIANLGGGGAAKPLPFVGTAPSAGWTRPALATFSTWLNQDTDTTSDGAGGLPLVLKANGDQGASNAYPTGLLKAIGAPPWTITAAVAGFGTFNTKGASYTPQQLWFYPIILKSGVLAECFTWFSPIGQVGVAQFSTVTTPLSEYPAFVSSGTNIGFPFPDYFEWFRVANDGVNLTYSISPDGQLWFVVYTEAVGSFLGAIDHVGFGMDRSNFAIVSGTIFGSGQMASLLWQWVET